MAKCFSPCRDLETTNHVHQQLNNENRETPRDVNQSIAFSIGDRGDETNPDHRSKIRTTTNRRLEIRRDNALRLQPKGHDFDSIPDCTTPSFPSTTTFPKYCLSNGTSRNFDKRSSTPRHHHQQNPSTQHASPHASKLPFPGWENNPYNWTIHNSQSVSPRRCSHAERIEAKTSIQRQFPVSTSSPDAADCIESVTIHGSEHAVHSTWSPEATRLPRIAANPTPTTKPPYSQQRNLPIPWRRDVRSLGGTKDVCHGITPVRKLNNCNTDRQRGYVSALPKEGTSHLLLGRRRLKSFLDVNLSLDTIERQTGSQHHTKQSSTAVSYGIPPLVPIFDVRRNNARRTRIARIREQRLDWWTAHSESHHLRHHNWSALPNKLLLTNTRDVWNLPYPAIPMHSRHLPAGNVDKLLQCDTSPEASWLRCWFSSMIISSTSTSVPTSLVPDSIFHKLLLDDVLEVHEGPAQGFSLIGATPERLWSQPRARLLGDTLSLNVIQGVAEHEPWENVTNIDVLTERVFQSSFSHAAVFDLEKSFYQVYFPYGLRKATVCKNESGRYYRWKRLPMGYCRATTVLTAIMRLLHRKTLQHIKNRHAVPNTISFIVDTYVDNIAIFSSDLEFLHQYYEIFHEVCKEFDFTLGDSSPPSSTVVHRGCLINLSAQSIQLKQSYRQKAAFHFQQALQRDVLSRQQLEMLIGISCYVDMCVSEPWDYRPYEPLLHAIRQMTLRVNRIPMNHSMRTSIQTSYDRVFHCKIFLRPTSSIYLFADASPTHLGALMTISHSRTLSLFQRIAPPGHINVNETRVLHQSLSSFSRQGTLVQHKDPRFLYIFTDNTTTWWAIYRRSSRSFRIQQESQEFFNICRRLLLVPVPIWIPTATNKGLADPISRGCHRGTLLLPTTLSKTFSDINWLDGVRWELAREPFQ